MSKPDNLLTDASVHEQETLQYILSHEKKANDNTRYLTVDEAIKAEALYEAASNRDVTRVLFISQDESLLNPDKQSLDGYTNLTDLFDEVHILILRQGIPAKNPVLRVAKNLWLYTATDRNWWGTIKPGLNLAEEQLVFADGFRPDIIVARDPFESAILALWLSRKYSRPMQVHVLEDYTSNEFLLKNRHNRWRKYIPRFTLGRSLSVRVSTTALLEKIIKNFAIFDLAVLPKFNNYEGLIKIEPTLDLREKYKQFIFTILYVGKLTHKSAAYRALDAARFGLKNSRIGMIFVGDGPAKRELEERAKVLGIKEQVVFVTNIKDDVPYLKSANVLVVTDTDAESEEIVLRAAACGIPIIASRTETREDLFKDGESILMCTPTATDEFSLKLNIIMNDVPLRRQLIEGAQSIIKTRFHENPKAYQRAYRETIEQVLFLSEDEVDQNEVDDLK